MRLTTARRPAALGLLLLATACIPAGDPPPRYGYREPEQQMPPPRQRDDAVIANTYEHRQEATTPAPPSAPPAWLATPVTPDARTIPASIYIVHPSDTLRSIANSTGSGSEAIARANNLAAPFMLRTGQQLSIPAGRYHLVRVGQTGIAIARAYGVPWSRIVSANDLQEPYMLRTGMRLLIPGSGTSSLADRAAAFQLNVGDIVSGGEPTPRDDQAPAPPIRTATRVLPSTVAVEPPSRLRGGFSWPLQGRVVSRFGPGQSGEKNNGIQIAAPIGTPIKASADGVVAYAGNEIAVLGGLVILRHGDGWSTVYGHTSRILVQRGQSVKRGETIAYSGNSGLADRPELHFEMRKGRNPVDPLSELSRSSDRIDTD